MISSEEFGILKEKLLQLTQRIEDQKAKIKFQESERENLPIYEKQFESIEKEAQEEESSLLTQITELSSEIKRVRSEPVEELPLENCDVSRELGEEIESCAREEEELKHRLEIAEDAIKTFEEIEREHQLTVDRYAEIQKPNFEAISMHIEDLLVRCSAVSSFKSERSTRERRIKEMKEHNSELTQMSKDLERELVSLNGELSRMDISNEQDTLNAAAKELEAVLSFKSPKHNYEEEEAEMEARIDELEAINEDTSDIEEVIRSFKVNQNIKITKMINLEQQLEKKREEMKQEIRQEVCDSEKLMELNEVLQSRWMENMALTEEIKSNTKAKEKLDDELRRKEIIYSELQYRWPANGKFRAEAGIKEQTAIFEEARTQNRQMASDMNNLQKELERVMKENSELK